MPVSAALLVALFLAALPLRPQLVGAAPLLASIAEELRLSHAITGLIGTIPVLCMGVFAPLAPLMATRIGTRSTIALSIALIGTCGLMRAEVADALVFMSLTIGLGIGIGVAGVLVPVFVKEQLPARPVAGTVAYASGLQLGAAAAAALAVPLADALGTWRGPMAVFSLLTLAVLGSWIALTRRSASVPAPQLGMVRAAWRDRRAWALALMFALFGVVYYGLIAWLAEAYVESGWSPASAGQLVAVLNVASLAGALTAGIGDRLLGYRRALLVAAAAFASAAVGFVVLPDFAWGWAALVGYANGFLFPLVLALPVRVARTPGEVAGLSTAMLGVGYALAAVGPIGLGALRDVSGSFQSSLVVIALAAVAFGLALWLIAGWRQRLDESAAIGDTAVAADTGPMHDV